MRVICSREVWYPQFVLGGKPVAVRGTLSIVEDGFGERRYLATPHGNWLDLGPGEDGPDYLDHYAKTARGYYPGQAGVDAYLLAEYPHWQEATAIMDALCEARHFSGPLVGPSRLADRIGIDVDNLYRLARGHRTFPLKRVRAAARALKHKVGK